MADPSSECDSKQERRRIYTSGSHDDRPSRREDTRRRSYDEHRQSDRIGGHKREASTGDRRLERRSRSPRGDRPKTKERRSPDSLSPEPRHGNHHDNRGSSRRKRSLSQSPSPKERRYDSREHARKSTHHRAHHRRSPSNSRSASRKTPPLKRSHAPLPSQKDAFTKDPNSDAVVKPPPEAEKQKPNYAPSGKLAAETNTVANTDIVLKYNEPPEARLPPPSAPWRLYIFKGSDMLETLQLHERSCWLFGRERAVVDFPTEHPSCSKQHAVLQFRYTEKRNEWGERKGGVKPYVIDLESANGTKVNGESMPARRFVEVMDKDVITFGESTREYVMILPPKEDKKG